MPDIRTSNLNPGVQYPSSTGPQGYNVPQPSSGAPQGSNYQGSQGYRGSQGYQNYPPNTNASGDSGMKKQAPTVPGRPPPPGNNQYKSPGYTQNQGQNTTSKYSPSTAGPPQQYSTPQYTVPKPSGHQQYGNSTPQPDNEYETIPYQNPEIMRNPNSTNNKPVAASQPTDRRYRNSTQSGSFTDINLQPNGSNRNSDLLNGYSQRNSNVSLHSDRSSAALNPNASDDDEPRSPLGQLLHFLDTEYSLRQSFPATLNTWISLCLLPFSFLFYIIAFSTVGWAEVDSHIIEGSPVNRKLGLWQLCHNISGCGAITSGDIGGSSEYTIMSYLQTFIHTNQSIIHTQLLLSQLSLDKTKFNIYKKILHSVIQILHQ